MKFSDNTIAILKSFSQINQNLVFKPGNVLRIRNVGSTIAATATIEEEIPMEAGVFDLTTFLAVMGLFKEPDVDFQENRFVVSEGNSRVTYTYASLNTLSLPHTKDVEINQDASFNLPWATLNSVIRAAGVLKLEHIEISGRDGVIRVSAVSRKDPSADTFGVDVVSDYSGDDFAFVARVENIKMMSKDYSVTVDFRGVLKFKAEGIEYIIATESNK